MSPVNNTFLPIMTPFHPSAPNVENFAQFSSPVSLVAISFADSEQAAYQAVLKLPRENDADKGGRFQNAIQSAANSGNEVTAMLLLGNVADTHGEAVLDVRRVAELLLGNGADVNKQEAYYYFDCTGPKKPDLLAFINLSVLKPEPCTRSLVVYAPLSRTLIDHGFLCSFEEPQVLGDLGGPKPEPFDGSRTLFGYNHPYCTLVNHKFCGSFKEPRVLSDLCAPEPELFTGSLNVSSVAFSPDGCRIVSGSNDKTVRIWNAETGELLGNSSKGQTGWVSSVAFSPDGCRIVSGSNDKTVRVWNAETGEPLGSSCKGDVNSVAFSPHGHRMVSGSRDRTVRIWDAGTPWLSEKVGAEVSVAEVSVIMSLRASHGHFQLQRWPHWFGGGIPQYRNITAKIRKHFNTKKGKESSKGRDYLLDRLNRALGNKKRGVKNKLDALGAPLARDEQAVEVGMFALSRVTETGKEGGPEGAHRRKKINENVGDRERRDAIRERVLEAREANVAAREASVATREASIATREIGIAAREKNITLRERSFAAKKKSFAFKE